MIYKFKDDKLSIIDISNIESRYKIWFQNKSTNRNDLDIEKEEDNNKDKSEEKENWEEKKSKIQKTKTQERVSLDILKLEIKQNK